MQILIVGAGVVGQTAARAALTAGASVTFMVKASQLDAIRKGLRVYDLNRRDPWQAPHRLAGFKTTVDGASAGAVDLILLCVASPALHCGDWLTRLAHSHPSATVLAIQPGPDDERLLIRAVGSERLLSGMVSAVGYHAPMAGDPDIEPGVAVWRPPGPTLTICGSGPRARAVQSLFCRGGLAVAIDEDVRFKRAAGSAVLDNLVAALECAHWSVRRLFADRALAALACRAAREAITIAARREGLAVPPWVILLRPALLQGAMAMTKLLPLDFETYLEVHFTKVGAQTARSLATLVDEGRTCASTTASLRCLSDRLTHHRAHNEIPISAAIGMVASLSRWGESQLGKRRPLSLDPAGSTAIKRNVHRFVVSTDAKTFRLALQTLLANPRAAFGPLRIKRPQSRVGRPFAVGDRFHGTFSLAELAGQWLGTSTAGRWARRIALSGLGQTLEDKMLSDYAEITSIETTGNGGGAVTYRYLSGCPIAGQSTYSIRPLSNDRCQLEQRFEFQECLPFAVTMMHRLGLRTHDSVVASQVAQAAAECGATILESTLTGRS